MAADRVVLLRHGRTASNAAGRFQGQLDVELDEVGRAQAAAVAPVMAGLEPSAIVASDLSRADATARAVAEVVGRDVVSDARLREIHCGSWQGRTLAEIVAKHPEFAAEQRDGGDVRRSATGEKPSEVAERFAAATSEWAEQVDGTLLVVAHGLAIRVGAARLAGLGLREALTSLRGIDNCGWVVLERGDGGWRIGAWNRVVAEAPSF